eukprot:1158772-Pelagomonas_calceolata.AAC.9
MYRRASTDLSFHKSWDIFQAMHIEITGLNWCSLGTGKVVCTGRVKEVTELQLLGPAASSLKNWQKMVGLLQDKMYNPCSPASCMQHACGACGLGCLRPMVPAAWSARGLWCSLDLWWCWLGNGTQPHPAAHSSPADDCTFCQGKGTGKRAEEDEEEDQDCKRPLLLLNSMVIEVEEEMDAEHF